MASENGNTISKFWKVAQIIVWIIMGGIAFGSLKTDFQGLKNTVETRTADARVSHDDYEKRLRSLEEDRANVKKDVEYIKQGIDEIKQEIRRRK